MRATRGRRDGDLSSPTHQADTSASSGSPRRSRTAPAARRSAPAVSTSPPTSSPTVRFRQRRDGPNDAPPTKPGRPMTGELRADKHSAVFSLLNKRPPPQITFRGYADRTVDCVRVVGSPALTATTHSPRSRRTTWHDQVAIVVGAVTGRDLTPILQGLPTSTLQVTYHSPARRPRVQRSDDPGLRGIKGTASPQAHDRPSAAHLTRSWPSSTPALRTARQRPLPHARGISTGSWSPFTDAPCASALRASHRCEPHEWSMPGGDQFLLAS